MATRKTELFVSNRSVQSYSMADRIIEYIDALGVEYIFGVPGGAIEPLYDAMARSERNGGARSVVARHESGAAFMADGYARETGVLGVCCATTGPGATNMITGVASAYEDCIPMLVITAQTSLPNFGRGALQDSSLNGVNTMSMFKQCTRYNALITHVGQLDTMLTAAIMATQGPVPGPAHISIPRDTLDSVMSRQKPITRPEILLKRATSIDIDAVERLSDELAKASKVALLVGDNCGSAIESIMAFAQLTNAAIVSTPIGKGLVDAYHPQFRGVFGFGGHGSARQALEDPDVDLVLAVGARLGEVETSGWDTNAVLNSKLVHIDTQANSFSHSVMAKMHVSGDLEKIFSRLVDHVRQAEKWGKSWGVVRRDGARCFGLESNVVNSLASMQTGMPQNVTVLEPHKCLSSAQPIKPQRLMAELAKRLPSHSRVFSDAGNSWAWTTHYLHLASTGLYRIAMGYGAMAWAIGAAIGTAMGCIKTSVVCITGDGSYLMSGQELTTAVAERLAVVFIVLNDSSLGMVKHGQKLAGAESIGHEIPAVDFAKVAQAMGANGITIETIEDLLEVDFDYLSKIRLPTVLDIKIDASEVPPMGERSKVLTGE